VALKKLKWLKYLFVNRLEAETEQSYFNEKRKKHLAHEHSEGLVRGLDVTEANPPSLTVEVAAGRALDTEGNDPEVESPQDLDCAALVPAAGEVTVYVTLRHNTIETDPYFVDELGATQNKFVQDSFVLEATPQVPTAPAVELARFRLGAGATAIRDAADPNNPGLSEIDFRQVKHSDKEVLALRDLSDVDPAEADAFNAMENPSTSNPITTVSKADGIVAPVRGEVVTARGTKPSLDARLDVMLNDDGSFKGISKITPAAPLTGGGTAGDVPVGINDATPTARGAMRAADKAKLDGIEPGATADQTAQEILDALKTVDGAGSGLDADLLDGSQHRGLGGGEHANATPAAAGFIAAGDKTKLDGIEPGATADQTGQEILDALKTVDGAGSGLDADLLDGSQHRGLGGGEHAVATPTVDGFMSAVDKAKLNGIEAGATGDQTAGEILSLLTTVDGAGSGLDADLLDGVQHRGAGGVAEHAQATTSQAGFMSPADKTKLDGVAAAQEYSFRTGTVSNGGFIPGPTFGFTEVAVFTSMYYIQCRGDVDDNDKLGSFYRSNRQVAVGDWDQNKSLSLPPDTTGIVYYMVVGVK